MRVVRFAVIAVMSALVVVWSRPVATAPAAVPGYQQFLSPASPLEVVAARKVDRIAWVAFEEGKRNAYTAAAPGLTQSAGHSDRVQSSGGIHCHAAFTPQGQQEDG